LLRAAVGDLRYRNFSIAHYTRILDDAKRRGVQLYNPAYRMGMTLGPRHHVHLRVLDHMMRDRLPDRLQAQRTLRGVYELLRGYEKVGDFIGYQLPIDLNYSDLLDFDEGEFVVPGPGTVSGLRKCFGGAARGREAAIIRAVAERQDELFASHGVRFPTLWGRTLQLIDVQNLICEANKVARVAHPEVPGIDKQTRIKQRYRPDPTPIRYWFPPKWGINAAVEAWYRRLARSQRRQAGPGHHGAGAAEDTRGRSAA
jgi:hypothetical protein